MSNQFDKWWAERVAEGYQYGREALSTVRFGFEAGLAVGMWQPISTAPELKTLLTIHRDDLFPVCAFYFDQYGERFWMRIIEGPEDVIRPEQGDHCALLRPPTHWMFPPEPPEQKGDD